MPLSHHVYYEETRLQVIAVSENFFDPQPVNIGRGTGLITEYYAAEFDVTEELPEAGK